jgi:hypothetical protein
MTLEHDLLQLARDAMRSLMNGREFAVGQTGHYLNIISRIEDELNRPKPEQFAPYTGAGESFKIKHLLEPMLEQEPAAKHWHDLYYAKCKDFQDQQTRLGAEIAALEEELAELKEEQIEQKFYPDWDMLKPFHERIAELEAELAKHEQEPFKPDWVNYRQGLVDGAAQPEQEPVAWIYDWYGYKSQNETKVLVKDWIASVYSEVSDPAIGAHNIRPLYTAPPRKPWVGLTNDEVLTTWLSPDACKVPQCDKYHNFYLAIEAKLKEKNNAV